MAEKEEEEKKEGEGQGEGEAKPKGKGKLIIIIVAVVLVLGGAGAFFMLGGKKAPAEGEATEEHKDEEERHLARAELDTMIVNLSETSNFLKVHIMLEMDEAILEKALAKSGAKGGGKGEGEGKAGLPPPLDERLPMIRDATLRVLSAKKAAEVLTPEGKEQIKEELVEALNEASGLDEGPIVAIYFTEFIVQ